MTVAEQTREAVRNHPFLYHALRAGVVNYTAAARFLDIRGRAGDAADRDADGASNGAADGASDVGGTGVVGDDSEGQAGASERRTEDDHSNGTVDEAVAVALRRYARQLPAYESARRQVRVKIRSGLSMVDATASGAAEPPASGAAEPPASGAAEPPASGAAEPPASGAAEPPGDSLLVVGDVALAPDDGSLTAIIAQGEVGPAALADALERLRVEDIDVEAAGAGDGHLVVAVPRRDGPTALRLVEDAV